MTSVVELQKLLSAIFRNASSRENDVLQQQIASIRAVAGPVTMLDIEVDHSCAAVALPDGPLPDVFEVRDADGNTIGELLTWMRGGFLSGLEYAWWTDDPPSVLPLASQIRVSSD